MTTQAPPTSPATILVVDDIPDNVLVLTTMLEPYYSVKVATNGERALKIAFSQNAPDLILLDVMMPGISGYEVMAQLKAEPRTRDIPVMFVTAKNETEDEIHGLSLGAVDYVSKPLNPAVVLARVKTHLRLREAEKERKIALDRQQELNEMRSRFVTMTSHEFRTPLSTILSSQELLKRFNDRLPEDKRIDLLNAIAAGVQRMTQMLDRVLLLGRAEAQMLEFKPNLLDVLALLETIAADARVQYATGRCELITDFSAELVPGVYDEALLRHIFSNLLSNAIKYSPAGGEVRFKAFRVADRTHFEVSDQGIGIPEVELGHLFELFHRASNVGGIQGTGLGLAIVKSSVELHGGAITVQSQAGQGSLFTVTLPIS